MAIHIVTGAPAAGKSSYVREHMKPGDIRIDFDEIANTLSAAPQDNHTHPNNMTPTTPTTPQE